ncbi:integrase [Pantoea agglomerans]|nr:integrase [Pantoea agglomerans]
MPLSRQVLALLEKLKELSGDNKRLFPGENDPKKVMSENTVNNALRAMGMTRRPRFVGMVSGQWHEVRWVSQDCGVMMR